MAPWYGTSRIAQSALASPGTPRGKPSAWSDLAAQAAAASATGKGRALLQILRRHRERSEKVIVFTAFRRTLDHLTQRAAAHGLAVVRYDGGLARTEKDAAIGSFADAASILLSTRPPARGATRSSAPVGFHLAHPLLGEPPRTGGQQIEILGADRRAPDLEPSDRRHYEARVPLRI
jgi:hypothetical protein